jgi:hypothetical protein
MMTMIGSRKMMTSRTGISKATPSASILAKLLEISRRLPCEPILNLGARRSKYLSSHSAAPDLSREQSGSNQVCSLPYAEDQAQGYIWQCKQ